MTPSHPSKFDVWFWSVTSSNGVKQAFQLTCIPTHFLCASPGWNVSIWIIWNPCRCGWDWSGGCHVGTANQHGPAPGRGLQAVWYTGQVHHLHRHCAHGHQGSLPFLHWICLKEILLLSLSCLLSAYVSRSMWGLQCQIHLPGVWHIQNSFVDIVNRQPTSSVCLLNYFKCICKKAQRLQYFFTHSDLELKPCYKSNATKNILK